MNFFKFTLIIFIITIFVTAKSPHRQSGEKARILMKWKLTEYLDISEEQGDKFFPRFNSFQKEHKSIHKQIEELFEMIVFTHYRHKLWMLEFSLNCSFISKIQ